MVCEKCVWRWGDAKAHRAIKKEMDTNALPSGIIEQLLFPLESWTNHKQTQLMGLVPGLIE